MSPQPSPPQQREHGEPFEDDRPVPRVVLVWIAILLAWGTGYYLKDIGKPMLGGDSRTTAVPASEVETGPADGATIFRARCVACHQSEGQGVPGSFPPLAASEWVVADDPAVPVAIVHDGLSGEINVAGSTFNGTMPPFGATLSAEEIAAVLTYVRGEWGNAAEPIEPELVEHHSDRFETRGPWSVDELRNTFDGL